MRRDAFSAALDGGYVRDHVLNFLDRSFSRLVDVLQDGILSMYQLSFSGITAFEFSSETTHLWERVELTEIRIEETPEGSQAKDWKVWLNFWDTAELSSRCAVIRVDGEPLS